jgi:hypothetical protein
VLCVPQLLFVLTTHEQNPVSPPATARMSRSLSARRVSFLNVNLGMFISLSSQVMDRSRLTEPVQLSWCPRVLRAAPETMAHAISIGADNIESVSIKERILVRVSILQNADENINMLALSYVTPCCKQHPIS